MQAMLLVRRHSGIGPICSIHGHGALRGGARDRLGVTVYDIYSFMLWFHAGFDPRDFGHPGSIARPWRER